MDSLLKRLQHFKNEYLTDQSPFDDLLHQGQKPRALIIGCADSRVDPAIITKAEPGELFVVRNVANLVPPFENNTDHHGTSAAIEFGVCHLQVPHIVILGHSQCGGIQALMSEEDLPHTDFIKTWVSIAQIAKDQVLAEHADQSHAIQTHLCERASILVSLNNLMQFPWIKERIEQGTLKLHGWYFNMKDKCIEYYDIDSSQWKMF